MIALRPLLLAILALAGCRAASPGLTMTSGDLVITAVVERLGEADQYKTDLTIERRSEDGSTDLIAAPSVISRAGERAEIRIDEGDRRLTAMIHVPAPDDRRERMRVQVTLSEPGRLRSPRMLVDVPPVPPVP